MCIRNIENVMREKVAQIIFCMCSWDVVIATNKKIVTINSVVFMKSAYDHKFSCTILHLELYSLIMTM